MTSFPSTTAVLRRLLLSTLVVAVTTISVVTLPGVLPAADALQTAVTGSADFRSAPQLEPGTYRDRIVTGDSAWYSVVYTNGTPYEFDVAFDGVSPPNDVTATVSFVAPTLTVANGPAATVSGQGLEYPVGTTNVWFLQVSLETSGQTGLEYPVIISVSGVESAGLEPCRDIPGCTLDEEYAALNVAIAEAQAQVESIDAQETEAVVRSEIDNLQGFIETSERRRPDAIATLSAVEAQVADLCAPLEPDCAEFPEPSGTTPPMGWLVGGLVLIGGAYRAVKRFGKDPADDIDEPKPQKRTPASLQR